jgi:exodeoxyribonuclease VII small subunit
MTDPTTDATAAGDDDLAYLDALDELEAILDRLERDEPDVDRVADDVARAAALIAHCRSRIAAARLTVDEVVAGLTAPGDDRAGDGDA